MIHSRLIAEMRHRKIRLKDLAEVTGKSYPTMQLKVAGKLDFKESEMRAIHEQLFSDVPYSELWA